MTSSIWTAAWFNSIPLAERSMSVTYAFPMNVPVRPQLVLLISGSTMPRINSCINSLYSKPKLSTGSTQAIIGTSPKYLHPHNTSAKLNPRTSVKRKSDNVALTHANSNLQKEITHRDTHIKELNRGAMVRDNQLALITQHIQSLAQDLATARALQ